MRIAAASTRGRIGLGRQCLLVRQSSGSQKGVIQVMLGVPAEPRSSFSGTQQLWGPEARGHLGLGRLLVTVRRGQEAVQRKVAQALQLHRSTLLCER